MTAPTTPNYTKFDSARTQGTPEVKTGSSYGRTFQAISTNESDKANCYHKVLVAGMSILLTAMVCFCGISFGFGFSSNDKEVKTIGLTLGTISAFVSLMGIAALIKWRRLSTQTPAATL